MRRENIYTLLEKNLGYIPTQDQSDCMRLLAQYVTENTNDVIFLLTGYAGTGKTSLIASLVSTLSTLRQKSVLLAPTGRAAKVLRAYTGKEAYTVHRKIYRQNRLQTVSVSLSLTGTFTRRHSSLWMSLR
jgi:exodeoxyribonuclease-5